MYNDNYDIITALNYIDPAQLTYNEWLAVGMELKAVGEDFAIFDEWSRPDPRYNAKDCLIKWRSFSDSAGTGAIIGMAYKNGYRPDRADAIRAPRRSSHPQPNADPADEIEPLTENAFKWNLTAAVEKAHRRLMEQRPGDIVKGYDGDKIKFTLTAYKYLTHIRKIPPEFIASKKIGFAPNGHNEILEDYPEYKSAEGKNNELHKIILPYYNGADGFNYFISEVCDRTATVYAGKDADGNAIYKAPNKYQKPKTDNHTDTQPATVPTVKAEIYNEYLLKQSEPPKIIFVVEGIYDALSVEICGGCAIAFVGTAHKRFISICKSYRQQLKNCLFVVALDNDASGNKAITRVINGLDILKLKHIEKQAPAPYKDFNETLQKAPEMLKNYISDIETIDDTKIMANNLLSALIRAPEPPKDPLKEFATITAKNARKRPK